MARYDRRVAALGLALVLFLVFGCSVDDSDEAGGECDFQRDFVMAGFSARQSDSGGPAGGRIDQLADAGLSWFGPTYSPPSTEAGVTERAEAVDAGLCLITSLFAIRTVTDHGAVDYHGPPGSAVDVADVNRHGHDEVADADESQLEAWAAQLGDQVRDVVSDPALDRLTSAWYLTTEELRYWKPAESRLLQLAAEAVRDADPQGRPFFSYDPGHASAERITQFLDVQDAAAVGIYPHYNGNDRQRIQVRYTVEQMVRAAAPYGGRKILPVLEMFEDTMRPLAPADRERLGVVTLHDAMAAVANGASGFLIWSFGTRPGFEAYDQYFTAWSNTVRTIRDAGLDEVVETGEVMPGVEAVVTAGPSTVTYRPSDRTIAGGVLPSVSVRGWTMGDRTFVVVVNSSEEAVTVDIAGAQAGPLTDLLTGARHGEGPSVSVTLPALGAVFLGPGRTSVEGSR